MRKHIRFWLVLFLAFSVVLPLYSIAADMRMTLRTEDGYSITTNTPSIKSFALDPDNNLIIILKDPPILDFGNPYPQIVIESPSASCTILDNANVKANPGAAISFTVRTPTSGAVLSSESIVPSQYGASFVANGSTGTFTWNTAAAAGGPAAPSGRYLAVFNATQSTYKSQLVVVINISQQYRLSLTAGANGTVNPSGDTYHDPGTSVQISATANPGYYFSGWSGNGISGTQSPLTITMDSDKSITANFTLTPPTNYTISTSVSPGNAGTVSGNNGSYPAGATVSLTAQAAANYTFSYWSEGQGATQTSTSNPYVFAASGNRTLVANFTSSAPPPPPPPPAGGETLVWTYRYTLSIGAGTEKVFIANVPAGRAGISLDLMGLTNETDATFTWTFPDGRVFPDPSCVSGVSCPTGQRWCYGIGTSTGNIQLMSKAAGWRANIPYDTIPAGQHVLRIKANASSMMVLIVN